MSATPMLDLAAAKERFLTTDEVMKALRELAAMAGVTSKHERPYIEMGAEIGCAVWWPHGSASGFASTAEDALLLARASIEAEAGR